MELNVNEAEIKRVMEETGMDYLQARNHLRGRMLLRQQLERQRVQQVNETVRLLAPKLEGATS